MKDIDPITVEIIHNRLMAITKEAGLALQNAAASTVVVDAKDLGFNISDHLGRIIVYSVWMPRHGTTLSYMLRSCLDRFKDNIFPGDMFLVNNPYDGALHLPDIALMAPVHAGEELLGWVGCAAHHLDVGAMAVRVPHATECHQEGIVFRPIKLMEKGELREDIFRHFLDNVRFPHLQGLDLKAQIASLNVATVKLQELSHRYGIDTIKACYEEIIALSEMKARERIRSLPDGKYEAIDYIDFDKDYRLKCTLTVKDDSLHFDFEGTDPQADGFVNSTLACSVANVHNVVVCMLFADIPSNEGCLRPIEVSIPEGTVLNCKPPAPSSGSSVIGGWKAQIIALQALSRAVEKSPEWWRANASWGAAHTEAFLHVIDAAAKGRLLAPLHGGLQGGGARATKDGFDVANEALEQRFPILYLRRGMALDSGGAGKYRGGLCGEVAMKLHKLKEGEKGECLLYYVNMRHPPSGEQGGQPGLTPLVLIKRQTNAGQLLASDNLPTFAEISGNAEEPEPRSHPFPIAEDDVIYYRCAGGGGFGDPLEREAEKVASDVKEGYISEKKAKTEYGVVLLPGSTEVDMSATQTLRSKMRKQS
ncbi:hydantoinase B/oxoprolinase family protein [Thermodesulfobacteriota bacterium]